MVSGAPHAREVLGNQGGYAQDYRRGWAARRGCAGLQCRQSGCFYVARGTDPGDSPVRCLSAQAEGALPQGGGKYLGGEGLGKLPPGPYEISLVVHPPFLEEGTEASQILPHVTERPPIIRSEGRHGRGCAGAHSQPDPTRGQGFQGSHLKGERQGMAGPDRDHRGPHSYPGCDLGGGRHDCQGVRAEAAGREPHGVNSRLLSHSDHLQGGGGLIWLDDHSDPCSAGRGGGHPAQVTSGSRSGVPV